jgi:tetratricopeptide (TPR) repeat protein
LAEHREQGNPRLKKIKVSKVVLPLLAALISFSMVTCVMKIKGEATIKKAFEYKQRALWEPMIRETEKAENYFYRLDPYSMPVAWYTGVGYFTLDRMDKALESFRQAYQVHPFNMHVLNNLAGTYARKGDYTNAVHYYLEALKISPQFSESLVNLSAIYYNNKEYEKAYKLIMSIPDTCSHPNYRMFKKAIMESVSKGLN